MNSDKFWSNPGVRKIVQLWNERPAEVIMGVTGLFLATAKIIEAASGVASKRAYAKRMNRRRRND